MRNGFARCLVLAGLATPALFACGEDKPDDTGTTAGSSSGGSSAGTQSGGSATAGTSSGAGTTSGGSGTAGTGTAGTGTAGTSTAGTASGGTGGSGGGSAGGSAGSAGSASGGGGGGASSMPTAVANITGLMGQTVTGTATFTQGATMTKLVLQLTACPNGAHSSHLHVMKDCGNNGNLAGGHWVPNGEMLGEYSCANNMVTHEISKPITTWTVGDGGANDVTKYAFMVHAMSDAEMSGARIGCGVINKQ